MDIFGRELNKSLTTVVLELDKNWPCVGKILARKQEELETEGTGDERKMDKRMARVWKEKNKAETPAIIIVMAPRPHKIHKRLNL